MQDFYLAQAMPMSDEQLQEHMVAAGTGLVSRMCGRENPTLKDFRVAVEEQMNAERIFKNDEYQVNVREHSPMAEGWPKMWHLSIKRLDREPIHDWRELQEIKNKIIGPEHEAVELYPAESRVVDASNQFHLWCFQSDASEGAVFPFGFVERFVCNKESVGGAKQRPRESPTRECDHPWHGNDGLITPCPQCGESHA